MRKSWSPIPSMKGSSEPCSLVIGTYAYKDTGEKIFKDVRNETRNALYAFKLHIKDSLMST